MTLRRLLFAGLLLWPALAIAQERETLVHDGIERTYILTVPDAVARLGEPVPLVIVLHGGGGNAVNAMTMTGFAEKAEEAGFIAVFPDGTGRTALRTWNAVHCCAFAMRENIDDVGFIAALIDHLVATQPVDPARVYVTGMSNGAMMAHQLAIALPDRFAAVGPVVGGLWGDEVLPPMAVPAIIINGAEDEMVPLQGGTIGPAFGGLLPDATDGTPLAPALSQAEFWAKANQCGATPVRTETGVDVREDYRCPAGAEVVFYVIKDAGHAWPGGTPGTRLGDMPTQEFDATDILWDFFIAHARQPLPPP